MKCNAEFIKKVLENDTSEKHSDNDIARMLKEQAVIVYESFEDYCKCWGLGGGRIAQRDWERVDHRAVVDGKEYKFDIMP